MNDSSTAFRRGLRTIGAAAALLLVAAGCGLPATEASTAPPAKAPTKLGCPKPPGDMGAGESANSQANKGEFVPEGATTALLCTTHIDEKVSTPSPLLTHDADQLVDELNQLRAPHDRQACTLEAGPTYDLVLGYPDGGQRVVTFEGFGCCTAYSNGQYRTDADLSDRYHRLLARDLGTDPANPRCPGYETDTGARKSAKHQANKAEFVPEGASSALVCVERLGPRATEPNPKPDAILTNGVDRLVDRMNRLPKPRPCFCGTSAGPRYVVVFGYPDRDPVVVRFDTDGCMTASRDDQIRATANLDDLVHELVHRYGDARER